LDFFLLEERIKLELQQKQQEEEKRKKEQGMWQSLSVL
jgi:hypothetical protein